MREAKNKGAHIGLPMEVYFLNITIENHIFNIAVFSHIRNLSANNRESLFARIGFFDIINLKGGFPL